MKQFSSQVDPRRKHPSCDGGLIGSEETASETVVHLGILSGPPKTDPSAYYLFGCNKLVVILSVYAEF